MSEALAGAESGSLPARDIPVDVGQYRGRINKIDRYQLAMDEVKAIGARDERAHLSGYEPQVTLAALRTVARDARLRIEFSGDWERLPDNPALSYDDQIHAYQQGAKKELMKWYFEQKREYGTGEKRDDLIQDSQQIAQAKRDQIIKNLTQYADKQNGLTFVNAEAQMSRNFVAQLEAGKTEINLGQRYATGDIEAAKGRHMAAVENIWPLIEQARKAGVTVETGHAVAGVKANCEMEIMAIAEPIGIGY
jgi:hypothetical protein